MGLKAWLIHSFKGLLREIGPLNKGIEEKKPLIITIDGPVGAGKSTVARLLAQRLGYTYIDSGAMYRALAWKALNSDIDLKDEKALERLALETKIELTTQGEELKTYVDGCDVSHEIRKPLIGQASSVVSALPGVRKILVELQRSLGKQGRVVIEGRDIGTVVFPNADVKFYLNASLEERGRRRHKEVNREEEVSLEEILEEVKRRDSQDMGRTYSPLSKAPDAISIDTTKMGLKDVVETMLKEIQKRI